jgi:hypothetical protein
MSDEAPDREPVPEPPPMQPGAFDYAEPPTPPQGYAAAPQDDALGRLIPTKNPKALAAYYCGVFALVPCFSPVLGPLAIIFGLLGLKETQRHPGLPGKGHAITGIILGGIMTLAVLALVVVVVVFGKRTG